MTIEELINLLEYLNNIDTDKLYALLDDLNLRLDLIEDTLESITNKLDIHN